MVARSGGGAVKAAHDPLFTAEVRRAFMARLGSFGFKYADVADELERLNLPRPSVGSGIYRRLILDAAALSGCDAINLAERVRPLYSASIHSGTVIPADAAGYIAALTAPADRPPVAAPAIITAAQVRFVLRIGRDPAPQAATTIARMSAAQRTTALTLALRLSAMPGATEAANRLRGAA